MVEEILYTDLRLDTPDAQTHGWSMTYPQSMALYRTLEVPRISELVTSLRIDLAKWLLCPKSIIRRRVEKDKGSKKYPCRCASLDAALGKALVALPNLVILHLRCWLCWQDGPPMFRSVRHLYLRNLCTRNLQHFSLQCGCLCKTRTRWDNLLASPCLADIRSLDLQWSYYFPPESPEEFLISHKGVLPRLEAMTYIDDSFSRALLRSRPIKRLANFQYGSRASATRDLHENLEKSPGELTHLFVEDLRQWLEKSIVVNLEPYRNLQSVGCVAVLLDRAKTQEENVLNSMKPLIPLQRLEEIELMYHWEPEPVAAVLCERMCQKHPRLRRIFFSVDLFSHSPDYAPKTMTWERDKAGLWKGTRGPLLNWWDYICQ
ncbi:hypothetical protein FRC18_007184 [Serendipita sp. 400]|nr:hypothetical protein FRC18_007184 [Serendipita sp. 400]